MPLTHTVINKLSPSSTSINTKRPDKYSNGNGLQLWVRYTGDKSLDKRIPLVRQTVNPHY